MSSVSFKSTSDSFIDSSFLIFLLTIAPSVNPKGKIFSCLDFFDVTNFLLVQKPPSPSNFSPIFESFFA